MTADVIDSPLLEVSDLSMSFGGLAVLSHVSCSVAAGGSLGIIGPNGAGKTTLLNCINGLYRPQTGTIALEGRAIVGLRPQAVARLGVARTFQAVELFGRLSAFDNVLVAADQAASAKFPSGVGSRRAARRWAVDAAVEALETLGLSDLTRRTVKELSFGEQKAVALARAVAMKPKVLLLDEPTSGMGATDRRSIGDLVGRLQAVGVTIVLIEHDVGFIRQCCNHVVVLDFGEVIASGSPDEVVRDARVQRAYLGTS